MKEFSLLGFAAHLVGMAAEIEHANHSALEKSARIVKKQAKDYIGTYDAKYPTPWHPLAESTKKDRVNKGFPADQPLLRTGALRDSIEHTVSHNEATVGSNSQIAAWQELGTSKFVPRPFLEPALREKVPEILEIVGRSVVGTLSGGAREIEKD